jgi:hypothetical protein
MKKLIASLAAVALFAAPALAELAHPGITIPKGSYTIEPADVDDGTRHDPANLAGNYNNLQLGHAPQTQYRIPNNLGGFVGDDLHMVGTTVTGYRWVYSDPGAFSHSSSLAFFNMANPADGGPLLGNTVTFVSGTITYGAVFNVTGLPEATVNNPGGGWLITVGLPALTTATDIWVGLASNSLTVSPPNTLGLRGTDLNQNVPAGSNEGVGFSHNLHWSGFAATAPQTSFFTNAGGGNFRMAALPEPAVACLLALGGLVVLRRRK